MKRILIAVVLFAISAPASGQTIGPKGDRYELRVGKPKADVYAAALATLTDATFTTKEASQDGGVIQTEWRKPSDVVEPGAKAAAKLWLLGGYPVRLNMVFVPVGTDSTRVTITGDYLIENISATSRIKSYQKKEWGILQGIGDEILKALR